MRINEWSKMYDNDSKGSVSAEGIEQDGGQKRSYEVDDVCGKYMMLVDVCW